MALTPVPHKMTGRAVNAIGEKDASSQKREDKQRFFLALNCTLENDFSLKQTNEAICLFFLPLPPCLLRSRLSYTDQSAMLNGNDDDDVRTFLSC